MKTIVLAYDADSVVVKWKAEHDSKNRGWIVTDHQGDKKFFGGCIEAVIDHMERITLANWGMRLLGVR